MEYIRPKLVCVFIYVTPLETFGFAGQGLMANNKKYIPKEMKLR